MNLSLVLLIMAATAIDPVFPGDEHYDIKIMSVLKGTHAHLPCGGLSVLKTGDYITWFKNGEVVATYRIYPGMPAPSKLVLKEVRDEDAGTYVCRVVSMRESEKNNVVLLDVLEDLSMLSLIYTVPPVNVSIRTDNNDNFEAGSPRVLACIVYGCIPLLNVTWYLGDTMLRPNVYEEVNRGNYTVSSLTFVPSLTDNGKDLVCKVTNHFSSETFEDRVTVNVGHRPMCVYDAFRTIGAVQGDSETLVCMVESDPEPDQFIWTFADGRTVYTSSKKVLGHENRYSSTLVWVPKDDDYGPLYCRGSNRFGEQKLPCTFSVINGGPPTIPECNINWEDQETLKVNCDKNWDGGRPQTIHVEVITSEGTRTMSQEGNELKVHSLQRGSNFTLVLYATNSRGRSLTLQVAMPPSPPPDIPPERAYTTVASPLVVIINNLITIILVAVAILICCCYNYNACRRFFCCHPSASEETQGDFHREEEMVEMDNIANRQVNPIVMNANFAEEQDSGFQEPGSNHGSVDPAEAEPIPQPSPPEVRVGWQFANQAARREEFYV